MLFSQDCTSIPGGFWTHVADTVSGLDIRFFDTDDLTELKREMVFYDSSGHKVEAWIQIPSLLSSVDKEIWCHYGESTVVNSVSMWSDIGYSAIYHLQSDCRDSLGVNNGVPAGSPTPIAGPFGGAFHFNGSSDYFDAGDNPSTSFTTSGTIEAWVKPHNVSVPIIASKCDGLTNKNGYVTFATAGIWGIALGNASTYQYLPGYAHSNTDLWYHHLFTWDALDINVYANGGLPDPPYHTTAPRTITPNYVGYQLWLGRSIGRSDFYLDGDLDEVRLGPASRSAEWAWTNYNTQRDSSSFLSCGAEQGGNSFLSYFSQSLVSINTSATSLIDKSNIVNFVQIASGGDTYFDSTSKLSRVDVYYTHQAGRQNKKVFHLSPNFSNEVSWSTFARDGTWEKTKIKVFDQDGATYLLQRDSIGTSEDIIKTDSTVILNTI